MKGSEGRNVFSSILSRMAAQYKTPIQMQNGKYKKHRMKKVNLWGRRGSWIIQAISVPQFTTYKIGAIGLHGFQDWFIPEF